MKRIQAGIASLVGLPTVCAQAGRVLRGWLSTELFYNNMRAFRQHRIRFRMAGTELLCSYL